MKFFLSSTFLLLTLYTNAQVEFTANPILAAYSAEWNNPDSHFSECNTAVNVDYMSPNEKDVIYILNLVRSSPALFANTVLKNRKNIQGKNCTSLINTLLSMPPLTLLIPDKKCYNSAAGQAASGLQGYVGHIRQSKTAASKKHFDAECCDYGDNEALEIVLSLLIDNNIPSLIHRTICLGDYTSIGVALHVHTKYKYVTVLDFEN